MQDGKRWIYYKGRRILVNANGNIVKDNKKHEITETKDKDFKNYYKLSYKIDKKEVGHLEYQKNNDNITINSIKTNKDYQRQGIATSLLQELKKKFGDRIYKFSAVLDDGEKLLKSKTNIIRKDDYDYYVKIK